MNGHDIERIASAIHVARPDWPVPQLRTLITDKLADRPRRDVFVALAWVASEPASANPYRVLESGPWWIAAAVAGDTAGRREVFNAAICCGVCAKPNDHRHPVDHAFETAVSTRRQVEQDAASKVARLRAIRDETAATHCAHGVPFANCVEHRAARKTDQGGEPA